MTKLFLVKARVNENGVHGVWENELKVVL